MQDGHVNQLTSVVDWTAVCSRFLEVSEVSLIKQQQQRTHRRTPLSLQTHRGDHRDKQTEICSTEMWAGNAAEQTLPGWLAGWLCVSVLGAAAQL